MEPSPAHAQKACAIYLRVLCDLGVGVQWRKVELGTRVVYLGVAHCSTTLTRFLPADRVVELQTLVEGVSGATELPRKAAESIAGKLCWAAAVAPGVRPFLRFLFSALATSTQRSSR